MNSLKKLGFIPQDTMPFPRLPMIPDWKDFPEEQRKIEARRMELYSAMIENVDHHLGRLFKHLKKIGVYDNTLIIFFSDNGANGNEMHQYPDTDKAWLDRNSDIIYDNDTAVSWELIGFRAVRKGNFKLVWLPIPFGNDDWQLYDLSKDPAEINDLSQERPKLRKGMIEIWKKYSQDVGVVLPPGGAMRMDINLPPTQ